MVRRIFCFCHMANSFFFNMISSSSFSLQHQPHTHTRAQQIAVDQIRNVMLNVNEHAKTWWDDDDGGDDDRLLNVASAHTLAHTIEIQRSSGKARPKAACIKADAQRCEKSFVSKRSSSQVLLCIEQRILDSKWWASNSGGFSIL